MTVAQKIREALKGIMSDGEANAARVDKGYHYNGATESHGWYYKPFNGRPVTLGSNAAEAFETIEQIREERRQVANDVRRA